MRDLRQSPRYANWIESMGWKAVKVQSSKFKVQNYLYLRKIPILGSVIKLQRPEEPVNFGQIKEIAGRERAMFVKMEPKALPSGSNLLKNLSFNGYGFDRWALVPTKTLKIDLCPEEKDIYEGFKKDCRYEIRKAQFNRLKFTFNDFKAFYQLLRSANKIKGLWTYPEMDFDNLVRCFGPEVFCVSCGGEPSHQRGAAIAGCLVLIADKCAYYFLAGSLPEGKEKHIPYLVVWEAMREAKKRGCVLWDFEGIYDSRYVSTKKWKGFTHFKESFGGKEITFPGSFTWYRNPVMKFLSLFGN